MKKYLLLIFLLLFISSCSNNIINVTLGTPFELKVGQTAEIEGHRFTFTEVSSDSRCPVDAECIWTGEATVLLVSQDDDGVLSDVYISTYSTEANVPLFPQTFISENCNENVCTIIEPPHELGYLISLDSLLPLQEVGKEIKQEDYVAMFTIGLSS